MGTTRSRERADYGPGQAAARAGMSLGEWRRAVRSGLVRSADVDGARWSAAVVERARSSRASIRTQLQVLAAPEYRWGQAPAHLLTRAQLAETGPDRPVPLRPGGPIRGVVHFRRGRDRLYLYDVREAVPKRAPTKAQTAAAERRKLAARTCTGCGKVAGDRNDLSRTKRLCPACVAAFWTKKFADDKQAAAAWAREVLDDPATVFLDSETTDLSGFLVEISVTDRHGAVLLDSLIDPRAEIEPGAQAVHGIGAADLVGAPTYAELAERLWAVLRGRRVIIYNVAFDTAVLRREVLRAAAELGPEPREAEDRYWAPLERSARWECAMAWYAQWYGEWDHYHRDYTWQRLGGGHRALGDCRATRERLVEMAASLAPAAPAELGQPVLAGLDA
ncbi:3'-5' exonuclease (plasmid) [Nocardiopsis exhalans]|uniref:3'-5' exonuclease n=1 Tax=Nocardiopsis exhalans TaxID=163604 RepID=A0ABY5DGW0_9ACTN|nr:3'-5' exonuclease [Nocardiopsis exhalans]USY23581.1 3'-5' exonuclease [Nocardiopsis exhalans]